MLFWRKEKKGGKAMGNGKSQPPQLINPHHFPERIPNDDVPIPEPTLPPKLPENRPNDDVVPIIPPTLPEKRQTRTKPVLKLVLPEHIAKHLNNRAITTQDQPQTNRNDIRIYFSMKHD